MILVNQMQSLSAEDIFTGRQCPGCSCRWDDYGLWLAGTAFVCRSSSIRGSAAEGRYVLTTDTRACRCGGEMIFGLTEDLDHAELIR